MGTLGNDSLHIDGSVISQFQYGRESLSLFGCETVQQDEAFIQQLGDFVIFHLSVADNSVDVQHAGRLFSDVMLTTITFAGFHHVAAAQRAATHNFLFCFHFLLMYKSL